MIEIQKEHINKLYNINLLSRVRGGICTRDEFQDECENIDCIECKENNLKTNITLKNELLDTMKLYYEKYINEDENFSNKKIHYLYLAKLYSVLLEKTEENPNELEISLTKNEKEKIEKEIGYNNGNSK